MTRIDLNAVLWKEVNGAVVVLLIAHSNFIELNKVGSAIWKLVAEGKGFDEIVDKLVQIFDVTREKLVVDVKDFLAKMVSQGMMVNT